MHDTELKCCSWSSFWQGDSFVSEFRFRLSPGSSHGGGTPKVEGLVYAEHHQRYNMGQGTQGQGPARGNFDCRWVGLDK
eukprot:scaffold40888_cov20-Tisochrysis_lutea.AAC.3